MIQLSANFTMWKGSATYRPAAMYAEEDDSMALDGTCMNWADRKVDDVQKLRALLVRLPMSSPSRSEPRTCFDNRLGTCNTAFDRHAK